MKQTTKDDSGDHLLPKIHHSRQHTIIHRWLRIPYRLSVRYKRMSRPFATTYVLIHGLADTGELWRSLLDRLPPDSNYIVVDLLGHGASKYPNDQSVYSASEQARYVLATCVSAGLSGPVVLIGHSFGGLVAVEFSHKYHGIVQQVVLVSPPIYRDETSSKKKRLRQEALLRAFFRQALKKPDLVVAGYDLSGKLGALGFSQTKLTKDKFAGFESTIRAGIISQRAARYLRWTDTPTTIIYGRLDPFVVSRNFVALARKNKAITLRALPTSHAVRERTFKEILKVIS